mmetsp:Transcript_6124/g.9241  ORF Transcript_6124/g.9241 Transcript_6124/m.9241 type:complete len:427 (-) Transcript_6124:31-1311(-)
MSNFEDRITELEEALKKEKKRYTDLEDEADLLACENERLRQLLTANGIDPSGAPSTVVIENKAAAPVSEVIIPEGDGRYASVNHLRIDNASNGLNVLCSAYCNLGGGEVVACGGVDKSLRVYDAVTGLPVFQHEFSAPLLAMAVNGTLVACSMMDGGLAVVDLSKAIGGDETGVGVWRNHTKYVVSVGWSDEGKYLFTCSHDKSVVLYRRRVVEGSCEGVDLEVVSQMRFQSTPECAIFAPYSVVTPALVAAGKLPPSTEDPGPESAPYLVMGLRDSPYLLYVHSETLSRAEVSVNEHDWDTHVSFAPLHMALSPCGGRILVATDKDMHIIYVTGTNTRVRVLAGGHSCDSYGRPKVAWDCSGDYIYSNSQEDNHLHVYSLSSGRPVGCLKGHSGQIRDISSHPSERAVLTASYDHSVIEWRCATA